MPVFWDVPVEQFEALMQTQRRALENKSPIQLDFCIPKRNTIVQARNDILKTAVEWEYDFCLFLDDDNPAYEPYYMIEDLIKTYESNRDIHVVSGLIKSRDGSHRAIYSRVGDAQNNIPQYESFIPTQDTDPAKERPIFQTDAVWFWLVLMDKESFTSIYKKYHGFPVGQWLTAYCSVQDVEDPEKTYVMELADAITYNPTWIILKLGYAHLSENFMFWSRVQWINPKYAPRVQPSVRCFHINKTYTHAA